MAGLPMPFCVRICQRPLRVAFILALLLAALAIPAVQAAPFAVTVTMNDANAPGGNSDVIHAGPAGCAATGTGLCSLRDAILFANTKTAADTTTITLPAGAYTLTIPGAGETVGLTGDLNLLRNVVINGAGAGATIVQASATGSAIGAIDRVFAVALSTSGAVAATLDGLTVRYGGNLATYGGGGGIILTTTGSTLTLNDCVVSDNVAGARGSGGGIFAEGGTTLVMNRSALRHNATGNTSGSGGGIGTIGGTVTVTDSTVSDNTANEGGGGLANNYGSLTVTNGTLSGNTATYSAGGGIINVGPLTVTGSILSGNSAGSGGGGISHSSGAATVANTTISGNTTNGDGGGINNDKTSNTDAMTVTNSTISGNTAMGAFGGGGIYNGSTLTVTNSTLSGNTAKGGGGIFSFWYTLVTNSTLSANVASFRGGGVYIRYGPMKLTNDTISGNRADGTTGGGGIYNEAESTLSTNPMTAVNTLVAGNTTGPGPGIRIKDVFTWFAAGSENNLIGDGYGAVNISDNDAGHNIVGHPARVDTVLRDNGTTNGTQTLALLAGSLAIGHGDPASCAAIGPDKPSGRDQRGFARPAAACAIGAYEPQVPASLPPPQPTVSAGGSPTVLPPARPTAPPPGAGTPTPNPLPAGRP